MSTSHQTWIFFRNFSVFSPIFSKKRLIFTQIYTFFAPVYKKFTFIYIIFIKSSHLIFPVPFHRAQSKSSFVFCLFFMIFLSAFRFIFCFPPPTLAALPRSRLPFLCVSAPILANPYWFFTKSAEFQRIWEIWEKVLILKK